MIKWQTRSQAIGSHGCCRFSSEIFWSQHQTSWMTLHICPNYCQPWRDSVCILELCIYRSCMKNELLQPWWTIIITWVVICTILPSYTPAQRSWRGGILDSPCPSVRNCWQSFQRRTQQIHSNNKQDCKMVPQQEEWKFYQGRYLQYDRPGYW